MQSTDKRLIAIRYWLHGAGYFKALEALDLGLEYHTGKRKDGSPEFDHQVTIAQYLRTLIKGLSYPEETLTVAFLHDIREDYHLSDKLIRDRFGDLVANAVKALSKEIDGIRRAEADVFRDIAADEIASIVKGGDRIHNHQSMIGVFSTEKQIEYIDETKEWFFPMLKEARRRFPQQEGAYENIKLLLNSQIQLIEAIHAAEAAPALEPSL